MGKNLSIYFTNSMKTDFVEAMGKRIYIRHSFLSLASKSHQSDPDVLAYINPIQELHFSIGRTAGQNLGKLTAKTFKYQGNKNGARTLEYPHVIARGRPENIYPKWLRAIDAAATIADQFDFSAVGHVLSGKENYSMDCWDGAQAIATIIDPKFRVKDHFANVSRGWPKIVEALKGSHSQEELVSSNDLPLDKVKQAIAAYL